MRTFFFTVGLFAVCQGAVCLGLETLTITAEAAVRVPALVGDERVVAVPVWFGATLVATGVVTLLYAVALPRKKA